MTTSTSIDHSEAVPCHACGYDVRAQPGDAVCPECQASVAQTRAILAKPSRPAWRDSDPRWRRRMLAGAWILTLVLGELGWAKHVPVPIFLNVQRGTNLGQTLGAWVYPNVMFCVGAVLLFSRERGRRRNRLDVLRPWGVVSTYGTVLFGLPDFTFMTALVIAGIVAQFQSMPSAYRPVITPWLSTISIGILRNTPVSGRLSNGATSAFSSITMLLACVPLFDAMRSSGRRGWAAFVLIPLALAAIVQFAFASVFAAARLSPGFGDEVYHRMYFFDTQSLSRDLTTFDWHALPATFVVELAKWMACANIAIWLSVAQLAAKRKRGAHA